MAISRRESTDYKQEPSILQRPQTQSLPPSLPQVFK
jgi:hypothetical protein